MEIRAVVQRVKSGSVLVGEETVGKLLGFSGFLGVGKMIKKQTLIIWQIKLLIYEFLRMMPGN